MIPPHGLEVTYDKTCLLYTSFQETVKIYQQGKKYYDALKSVNNLVKDARKVQQTILMMGDITDIYVNSFQRMLRDGNFRPEELSAIASGYTDVYKRQARHTPKQRRDKDALADGLHLHSAECRPLCLSLIHIYILAHLICHQTAQSIKTLTHIGRIRIQIISV